MSQVDNMCPLSFASENGGGGGTKLDVEVAAEGIPQGDLRIMYRTGGKAGRAWVWSEGGPIGSVRADITKEGGGSARIKIDAEAVRLNKAEWDIDGSSLHATNPKSVYLDSAGQVTGQLVIDIEGDKEFQADTSGRAIFKGFNFRIPSLWPPDAHLQYAGCMQLLDETLSVNFPAAWGLIGQPYVFFKNASPKPGGAWGTC